MRKSHQFVVVAVLFLSTILAAQDSKVGDTENRGNITHDNMYQNPALGISMTLPGSWRLLPADSNAQEKPQDSGCKGPLCGNGDIRVSMQSTSSVAPQMISLIAYRLMPPYLDRQKYPLGNFAQAMTQNSLGGSGWIPDGGLMFLLLAGQPAYRLSLHRNTDSAVAFGYVSQFNGYMVLLVGAAQADAPLVQSAIEGMTFNSPVQLAPLNSPPRDRIRVGGTIEASLIVKKVPPKIPEDAHITGTVTLHAVIGKDGTVQQLQYISGPPLLIEPAIDAARQWVYKPTTIGGRPMEVDTTINVVFPMPEEK